MQTIVGGDLRALKDLLTGVDLLYDATAETGLQYLLSDLAGEQGIPYICVSTNEGAWGGLVARILPGKTGSSYRTIRSVLIRVVFSVSALGAPIA